MAYTRHLLPIITRRLARYHTPQFNPGAVVDPSPNLRPLPAARRSTQPVALSYVPGLLRLDAKAGMQHLFSLQEERRAVQLEGGNHNAVGRVEIDD